MITKFRHFISLSLAAFLSACVSGGIDHLSPSDQAMVHAVENALNRPQSVTGSFEQVGPGNWAGRGHFTYRPGYLLLAYVVPHGLRAQAENQHLVVIDKANGALTRIGLARHPLGLLLRKPLRLTRAIQVTQLVQTPGLLRISLAEAANPSQGLLSLDFEKTPAGLRLKNLIGTDVRKQKIQLSLHESP